MNRSEAGMFAQALRGQLLSAASNDLLTRLADRGGINVGLNPPDETEDEELAQMVWRALEAIGLAEDE